MATVAEKTPPPPPRITKSEGLRATPFDNVVSLLVALLMLLGVIVGALLMVWLSNRVLTIPVTLPVVIEDVGGGRPDGVVGDSMELDEPDAEQIGQQTDLQLTQVEDTLSKVSTVISSQLSEIDQLVTQDAPAVASGGGKLQGDGRRVAYGFGDGPPGIPRYKRWEIYYASGGTMEEYARQLDYFKIELAAVGGEEVIYLSNLSAPAPSRRTGAGDQEKRLYMSWRQGNLKQADRRLLSKAGVQADGKLIVQFYSPEIEQRLAQLEVAFAGRKPGQIRRTRFAVRKAADGYEYYVLDQTPL
jgi:hypothetical protein